MSKKKVQDCVTSVTVGSTTLPCIHMAWPESSAPELPWAVFYIEDETGLHADGVNYSNIINWTVELYEKVSNETLESDLESAIQRDFGPFNKYETWVDSENCLMVAYRFTEIERKENG